MKHFFSILRNELKTFVHDSGAIMIVIFGIVAYVLFSALPYYNEVIKDVPMGIVDFDNSNFSRSFVRNLNTTDAIEFIESASSIDEIKKEFYKNKIKGFVVIPKNFEKDIFKGQQVTVSVYTDSAYLIIHKTVYSAVMTTAINTGSKIEIKKLMNSGISAKQAITTKQPFEFVSIPLFNQIGGYKSYVYPIILVIVLHQTFVLVCGLLQGTRNEKKEKYCENDKDIPLTLFARTTFYFLIYLIYGVIIFFAFPFIFNYPLTCNILPALLLYGLMLYATGFFSQTISYLFKTRETVLLVMVPTSLIFIFIPGLIWPRESIPFFVNIFSFFIPATCGVDGLIKLNQNGANFLNVIYDFVWLACLDIIYFISAVLLTQKNNKKIDTKI